MSNICICVLVGLPASGKTSLVQKLKEIYLGEQIVYHVCYDDIIKVVGEDPDFTQWKPKRQMIVSFVEELVRKLKDSSGEKIVNGTSFVDYKKDCCYKGNSNTEASVENTNNINEIMSTFKLNLSTGNSTISDSEPVKQFQCMADKIIKDIGRKIDGTARLVIEDVDFGKIPPVKHFIIIDDNMYYKSMRYAYYRIARKHELSFCMVYVDVGLEQSLKNNAQRNEARSKENTNRINNNVSVDNQIRGMFLGCMDPSYRSINTAHHVTNETIINMSRKLEPPVNEGFEKNKFLTIHSNDQNAEDEIKIFLDESFKNKISLPCDKSSAECHVPEDNLLQMCDLILRKIVSNRMGTYMRNNSAKIPVKTFSTLDLAKTKSGPIKDYGEQLAVMKKTILKDIQNGIIQLEMSERVDTLELTRILNEALDFYLRK
ncbi:hypothetical protein M8J77_005220 [Diaphorina citri]|nr:hypothetical protein M8J77_005220 [Diaphorina citri]